MMQKEKSESCVPRATTFPIFLVDSIDAGRYLWSSLVAVLERGGVKEVGQSRKQDIHSLQRNPSAEPGRRRREG